MAASLDSDKSRHLNRYLNTSAIDTSEYGSSEDEAINLADCDQVSVEVKKDKVGVKDGVKGWTPMVKRRKNSCGNSDSEVDIGRSRDTHYEERYQEYMFGTDTPVWTFHARL